MEMALNPYAKEYVPVVTGKVSGLAISGAQKAVDQVEVPAGHVARGQQAPHQTETHLQPINTSTAPGNGHPRAMPSTGHGDELEFDESDLFFSPHAHRNSLSISPEDRELLTKEAQDHQGYHKVMPPNKHLGSPALTGIEDEAELLESVGEYISTEEDRQDFKDAICVPESDIQTDTQDVLPRAAGNVIHEELEDPEDVEKEAVDGSLAWQGSVYPDGLLQTEDEATSTARKLTPQDFELHQVIGQGAFGKVFLVSKRDSGEFFAMKVMRKDRILEKDHGDYVKAEKEVLSAVVHPYIVTLQYSFQTSSKLYLLLDFINGGHLFFQLFREGIFSEEVAMLYTAEIVLAISHLHKCGFVHRDLKPENVLMDDKGHIRITDFGLSKKNIDDETRTNSFIGTMEYMAPEIISGSGHGKSVDWWSVGILLYEMLVGVPPFRAKSQKVLKNQITGGKIKYPTYLSRQSQSILKGFLQRDAKKRLGYGQSGSSEVMKHDFFKGINWDKLHKREIPSKFRPMVRNANSIENFDKIWTDLPPEDSPCATPDHPMLLETFKDFSYTCPSGILAAASKHETRLTEGPQ